MKIVFTVALILSALGHVNAQCLLPLDISMDSTVNLLWEQYLERGDLKYEKINRNSYERAKKIAANPQLDSLFRVTRRYMVKHLGKKVFCEKVDMEMYGAFLHIPSEFRVQYRFFFDKIGKDNFYKSIQFVFRLKESQYSDKMVYLPNLPNCFEKKALCKFKVTHPEQALQIAREAGLLQNGSVQECRVNDDWEWEIITEVNERCGILKIYVDMRSGAARLSKDDAWKALKTIEEKVKASPIVIEGIVLETGLNYYLKPYSQISCIVEVTQVFKGEIEHGVIEVFGSGLQTTHGGLRLPPKGESAIFYLKSPADQEEDDTYKMVDSLSPYPLFRVNAYPIEIYQPYSGPLCYHVNIEKHLYQTIEKAAGMKRQLVLLPAELDSAMADFAAQKRMNFPVRQLGLEYMLFNKYGYRQRTFDTLRIDLAIRSTSTHSYLTQGAAVVRYSQVAYGDSIVSKKRLRFKPIQEITGFGNWHNNYRHIPDNYEFEVKDLSDSTFQVRFWRPEGDGDYFQLTPIKGERSPATPIVEFRVPVLQKGANLSFDFVEPLMQQGHYHYLFEQGKEVPYKFVWPNDPLDFEDRKPRK